MNPGLLGLFMTALTGLTACSTLLQTPKYQFTDGLYTTRVSGRPSRKFYVDAEEDGIRVYGVKRVAGRTTVDTASSRYISLDTGLHRGSRATLSFRQASFDADFLSILFKYRPPAQGFPNQFNTNVNGAIYLGYRSDAYLIRFHTDPLGKHSRQTNHYGFSFGGFIGTGATNMNPWVTGDRISSEYDGVVWTKGIAAILGVNSFIVGICGGWDHLLDRNRRYWIYQGRPWVGFAVGLNLN